MKRFFCTVCNKMKRVQRWPVIIENVNSDMPEMRRGECNRHTRVSSFRRTERSVARKVGA